MRSWRWCGCRGVRKAWDLPRGRSRIPMRKFGFSLTEGLFCESRFGFFGVGCVLCCESMWLDSVNALDSMPPRFCIFSFFRISLDSVIVSESKWLDSESCVSFRISALDSIDSKFLGVVFSRIFSRFSSSLVCAKEKRVSPHPALPRPEKNKAPLFLLRCACNPLGLFGNRGESLAVSLSRQNEVSLEKSAVALLPPCS